MRGLDSKLFSWSYSRQLHTSAFSLYPNLWIRTTWTLNFLLVTICNSPPFPPFLCNIFPLCRLCPWMEKRLHTPWNNSFLDGDLQANVSVVKGTATEMLGVSLQFHLFSLITKIYYLQAPCLIHRKMALASGYSELPNIWLDIRQLSNINQSPRPVTLGSQLLQAKSLH